VSNYNTIAWFYDRLASFIFGKTLINTQLFLVNAIPPASRILIVGGGTGWILEEIAALHPVGLSVTYIDSSSKMIALAKKRKCGANQVTFITGTIEAVKLTGPFDIILTPFLFDNFTNKTLQKIFAGINAHLKPKGLWLYCDFHNTEVFWQKFLLKIMYLFFRLFCGIEATRLPDADACFAANHFKIAKQKTFMNGFLRACIYEKV